MRGCYGSDGQYPMIGLYTTISDLFCLQSRWTGKPEEKTDLLFGESHLHLANLVDPCEFASLI